MNRRQLIKTAAVALPSIAALGRSAASLAQGETLSALHEVLKEIPRTNAWGVNMAKRYHEIRSGAFVGTYLVQLLDTTDSGSQRPTPAQLVSDLLPHRYDQWIGGNSPMLRVFVSQRSVELAEALPVLYNRRREAYSYMLNRLGIIADGTVAIKVFSGAMVATMVGLDAAFRDITQFPGLDPSSINDNDITDSLDTMSMYVYPC